MILCEPVCKALKVITLQMMLAPLFLAGLANADESPGDSADSRQVRLTNTHEINRRSLEDSGDYQITLECMAVGLTSHWRTSSLLHIGPNSPISLGGQDVGTVIERNNGRISVRIISKILMGSDFQFRSILTLYASDILAAIDDSDDDFIKVRCSVDDTASQTYKIYAP